MVALMDTAFSEMKRLPMNLDMVRQFPSKLVYRAVTAWPSSFIGWWEPDVNPLSLDLADEVRSRRLWTWEGARFDTKKLFLEIGPSYADLISKLAAGYIIYPDGTYNMAFFNEYRMLKEASSGRH